MEHNASESRHVSTHIDRPAKAVYDYASAPSNLPRWAHGLGNSIAEIDGQWIADSSPLGRVLVAFAPRNEFGVLDHDVTLPSGETIYNPVRVIADRTGCEVVFTLRRQPDMSDEDFQRDTDAVTRDLATLKRVMERAQRSHRGRGADGRDHDRCRARLRSHSLQVSRCWVAAVSGPNGMETRLSSSSSDGVSRGCVPPRCA